MNTSNICMWHTHIILKISAEVNSLFSILFLHI
uniref:Glycine-rich domain-containing protein-like protein n=1 Tax=Myoviridae sp. ctZgq1 TaxID=2826666 RepID=A0A8S5LX82_9CAUD|nr:MAG TPA: glycine-rich domain-containing protein-like protein [Myoviridae sp. ctZgq1]DAM38485.1 MAG TPA: Glycine-rich domain-containing protein-like protein [Caudoviricetes sp.]